MNKTYKVIFSKVRGALMVCNEITSSVQKKGIQLVVATAGLAAMAGASAADVLTITGTPTADGNGSKTRITGQFVKNSNDGVTGSLPTNQWWFEDSDKQALSATYFSQVELKDIQLETYPGDEAKGWTRMSGIETVSLENVNLSISGTEEDSKSFIWANSLTTSGQKNIISVGGLGVGEFKLDKYDAGSDGSLTLGGQEDKFEVASDKGLISMTVGKADINSTTSATFLGLPSHSITLTANQLLTVKTPLLVLSHTTINSNALAEFSGGASQTIKFESGDSGINAYVGLKADGLTIETKSGATGIIYAPLQQTNLTNIKIDNQGTLTIDANGGNVTISELKHSAENPSTTLSGNVKISAVNEGFSGKLILGAASSFRGNSTLTLSSAAANTIGLNLHMGDVSGFNSKFTGAVNTLHVTGAKDTPYEFKEFRRESDTGNSFVTVDGIVETDALQADDKHILKEAGGLKSKTSNQTIEIDYGADTQLNLTGIGSSTESSIQAGGISLKTGSLNLGSETANSVFGLSNARINVSVAQGAKLSLLNGDKIFANELNSDGEFNNNKGTVSVKSFKQTKTDAVLSNSGTFTLEGNGTATISGGKFGTSATAVTSFNKGSTATVSGGTFEVAGGTFTNAGKTTFEETANFNFTGGEFKTANGGTSTLKAQFKQSTGKTTVEAGGTLNLASGAEISGGTFESSGTTNLSNTTKVTGGNVNVSGGTLKNAGEATFSGNSTLNVKGGTFQTAENATTEVQSTFTQTTGTTQIDNGGTFKLSKATEITGGTFNNAGTAEFSDTATVSDGEFKTASTGVTTVTRQFTQKGNGKTTVEHGGTLNLNGDAEIVAGEFSNAGSAIFSENKELKVTGGTFGTATTGVSTANGTFTQTGGTTDVKTGGQLNLKDTSNLSGGKMALAGTTTFEKGLTASGGEFTTQAGGTTNVKGTFTQNGTANTTVEQTGNLNLDGGAEIAGGEFSNAGKAIFAENKELKVTGGTFGTATNGITTVKGTFTQSDGTTDVKAGGELNLKDTSNLSGGKMALAGTTTFEKGLTASGGEFTTTAGGTTNVKGTFTQNGTANTTVEQTGNLNLDGGAKIAGGTLTSSGTTNVSELAQSGGEVQVAGGALTAQSATLKNTTLKGDGKLSITAADLTDADIKFTGNATVEVEGLKENTTSLGKITVDDNSAEKVEGTFAYKGTKAVTINSLKLGDNDQLNFSATNAEKLNLDASKLVAAENSVLNWNVKETSVTGTGGEFKGQMKLADVEGKSDGLKLTISNETFDAAFGNNKGTLDLGKRGTAEGNQHIRNTLNVTGGALDFSSHTSVTGSSVSGDGLITANDGIKLGGKYSGTPELQTSGTLTVGDRNGDFTLGSGSVVTTSGGLAKTQETPAGKVTVKGTLNVMGGESNIGATNLEVAPESGGKGLILSGTEGSVTKLTTTGSLTTSAGGTTVGSHAELNVGTAKANGDAALKVEGGKMIAGSLEAGEKSTSVTNQGSLTVTGGLKATGTDALKVTGTGSSVTTTNLNASTGSTTVSDGGKLTVTGALNATGVNAVKVTGTGSTLDAQGTLAFDGKVNGESVIAIENDGGMKVKAGHALKKEGDRITSSLSGMIGVAAGSKGFVELDGLSDWINTNFDPSTEAGKKQKLTYREVRDILAALDGDPDKSKLILKLGNVFDWSEYEINLGSENPIDYDEFKKISGVDASTKDLINVNGDVVGNHSWGSATLKPAVGTTPAEEKLKLGSLGENLIDSADDKSGNLTLSKPTDDGYFVKKPTPGNENEGTAGDVELIGSSKSGSDPTVLKLVGTGKIGNVTGAGNKAHTKLTIEGKQDAESNTVTAGDLGNSGNELGELLVDNKVTVNAGDAAAGNVTVQRTSHLNLTGSLTTNAELVNVATDDKPAGDVLVTDKSSLKADSANIAGKLTVEKASSFETHHGAKIAKDLSLDHSSTAEIGGALEVTWGTSLANGSKLTANGDSSLGSLDVLGGSSFDNADKKLKVSKIPVGSETTSGNVFVSGQNSSVKAGSAEIAGALTVKDQATFVATGQGEAGKVSVTGPTQIDGAGSSYLAKGDSAMGDVLVKNGASFGYDQDGQPAGGKLEAKANQPYTAQDGTEKTSNGTVTVTSDNGDRSKLYASKADIAGTLTVNASDVATEGILTVAGETSVIGNGTLLAKGGSTLGELTLSGASSFGYGPAEDGSYTKKEGGKLKTLAGTSYNDADGNLKTSSGDVTVGGSSSLYAEEADIAGSLTVKETSIFETKETAKIAKDLTLDNAKADFGSALTVTVNGTLTNGAELKANGDSSLGSLDVSGASKFDIGNKKLTAIHNEQTSGDVVVKGNGSSVVAGEADIQGLLSVSDNATFKTTSATGVSSGDVNVASSATINKGIVEVGGDFRAAGELKLSNSSNLSVNQDAVANGLTVDASIASVGGQLTVDSPHLVLVKNGGALSAGNALLNEVKVENDPENAIKTNKLSFGKEGGSGTRIKKLYLAGNTELTFNASSDSSTDAGVNVVNALTVASGVNATINGIAAQYGAIALNGNLDAEKAILTAREGQGSLQVEGNADTPALARFGELDLAAASSGSVKNGLLAVGGQEALEANIESLKDEAKAALKSAKQSDVDVSSILYVNSALSAPNGTLTVGETTGMQFGDNTFGIGTGGFMILDHGAMDEPVIENGKTKYTAQLTGNIVNNGKMMFKNVKISGGTVITLADGNHTVSGDDANFLSGNFLYDARLAGNNLIFTMSETGAAIVGGSLSESLQETVMNLAEGDGFDSSRRDGAGWIASVMEDVTGDGNRTPEQIGRDFGSALESVSRMTAQSGTFLVMDTVKHVAAGSVEERLGFSSAIGTSVATEETFGRTLWATPLYNKTKADAFKAGNFTSGSDVDMYGITVGADVVVRDDTRLGAALYAGSGKADSRGSLATTKNDFDFYGAALYFGHSTGAWSFMGDLGFGYVTNDVKQTNHGLVKSDMDSTVFTAGLKAKYAFDVAGMQVAPFAGLRLNHIDSKNYSAKTNAQGTILNSHGTAKTYAEVPLGVQLSRDFMTQTGWTIKPALDLAVTPVVGSKNLTETIRFTGVSQDVTTSSEVLDRMRYSAALGVSGGKDKVGFGVSVGYSGSKNTDAFAVKANVRWTF